MLDEHGLAQLLGEIYEAALEPGRWPAVLERVGDLMNGSAVVLGIQNTHGPTGFMAPVRVDPASLPVVRERFGTPATNVALRALVSQPTAVPMLESDFADREEFLRSTLYHELLRPQGLRDGAQAVLARGPDHFVPLSIMQREHVELFGDDHRRLLDLLLPHLRRAAEIFLRLGALEARRDALGAAVDRLALGVVLVDGDGGVVQANRAAEAILAEGDGLWANGDGLAAACPAETRALRRLIGEAAATGAGSGTGAGGALALPRPSGRAPLPVLVAPLPGRRLTDGPGWPAAAVFVGDPDGGAAAPGDLLACLYGLTRAEAALAVLLLQGKDVAAAADELGVTANTARTHLKAVFAKTGVQRQAELVRLLLRGPAGLRTA